MNESVKPGKEQKHLIINGCLSDLEAEVSCLKNLVGRIEGSEQDKTTSEERKPISLTAFLNETPERLAQLTALLTEYRKKLTEYLF